MAGKGGGAWKVAYADFVTAMMAFFLVMWITAQSKPAKEAIANYFQDPFAPPADPSQAPAAPAGGEGKGRGRSSATKAKTAGRARVQSTSIVGIRDSERSYVGTTVPFEIASATLDGEAREHLKELLPLLRGKRNKIEIRGHTTRQPLSPDSPFHDAWQLSYARCVAVQKYLEENGIEPERMRLSQVAGYEPRAADHSPREQATNARVDVHLLAESVEDYHASRDAARDNHGASAAQSPDDHAHVAAPGENAKEHPAPSSH